MVKVTSTLSNCQVASPCNIKICYVTIVVDVNSNKHACSNVVGQIQVKCYQLYWCTSHFAALEHIDTGQKIVCRISIVFQRCGIISANVQMNRIE